MDWEIGVPLSPKDDDRLWAPHTLLAEAHLGSSIKIKESKIKGKPGRPPR
jgi:hypothetical protein